MTARDRPDRGDPGAPPHGAGGQRVEQQVAQRAPVDLRPVAAALFVEQHPAVLVEHPGRVPAGQDGLLELGEHVRRAQRHLTRLHVHVEHAALMAGGR